MFFNMLEGGNFINIFNNLYNLIKKYVYILTKKCMFFNQKCICLVKITNLYYIILMM
jgi:hypothetical protein